MEVGISERFGLPGHDLAHVTRIARAIEQRGFDSYWTPEHVAVRAAGTGGYRDGSGETVLADAPSFPDPFINLTAVAAATERLLLGTAVLLAPLHHPIAIARAGATLDALSGGRFVLGVGSAGSPGSTPRWACRGRVVASAPTSTWRRCWRCGASSPPATAARTSRSTRCCSSRARRANRIRR